MNENGQFIITIGASAGGIKALQELVVQFHEETEASVFVVLHLSKRGIGDLLAYRLQQHTHLPCLVATDGMPIKKGHIYVAPPDYHLIIKTGTIRIVHGPEENRWRPSIDVMMRSAAVAYGEKVIGIILTGLLDDGTAGMTAIKKCGGTSLVQDPNEAEYPDMPLSVLNNMEADYCVLLSQMGFVIYDTVKNKKIKGLTVPPELVRESQIVEKTVIGMEVVEPMGRHTNYVCPDCGGVLTELKENGFSRYRCYTGHVYTEANLLDKQSENMESTLWVALRMMEEKRNLLKKIAGEEKDRGLAKLAMDHLQRAEGLEVHIQNLKSIIFDSKKETPRE